MTAPRRSTNFYVGKKLLVLQIDARIEPWGFYFIRLQLRYFTPALCCFSTGKAGFTPDSHHWRASPSHASRKGRAVTGDRPEAGQSQRRQLVPGLHSGNIPRIGYKAMLATRPAEAR